MPSPELIEQALALLGGRLDRGDGIMVTGPSRPVSLVAPGDRAARIGELLAAGRRAAIPVALDAPGAVARALEFGSTRWRIASARRRLSAGGASRVHVVAIVPGEDMLALVYELGPRVQHYIEERVVLETQGTSQLTRRLKRGLGHLAGVAIGVTCVIVIGERA
jgi:hypothetical protein